MDSIVCLDHLSSLYYHLAFGFFALANFKEMSQIFGLFLLLALGFKFFRFQSHQISRDSSRKPRKSRNAFCSKIVAAAKSNRKLDGKCDSKFEMEGKCGSDLRKLLKMERRRASEARAEVERERAACGTAVEEAMGMIQRLQCEKSSIEMEFNQHRRLCEAKRIHDAEVIQSLEWAVQRYEAELSLLRYELRLFQSHGRHDDVDDDDESIPNFITLV